MPKVVRFALFLCLIWLWPGERPAQAQEDEVGNIDVVLVIDTSGSMARNDPENLRLPAAKLFIDLASVGDRFGIITMAGANNTRALTPEMVTISGPQSREQLKEIVSAASESSGFTHMGDALNLAYDLLANVPANQQRFVVLLTDGLPDPIAQRDIANTAVSRFQSQLSWPVFAIALGTESDIDFLEADIATPTGGRTFAATRADELVDVYLRVFEFLLDDRYIEQVTAPLNEAVPLVSLTDDHRVTQLSFVLHRAGGLPNVAQLHAPDGTNLVGRQLPQLYRSQETAYELYTVVAENGAVMAGDWTITINGGEPPAHLTLIARSALRARWLTPRATQALEERSLRFFPSNQPMFMELGALDNLGEWVQGLTPAVETAQGSAHWLHLADDGQAWDLFANDGRYTTLYEPSLPPGNYALRLELPALNPSPIHLYKSYPIELLPLPGLAMALNNDGASFGLEETLEGVITWQPLADRSNITLEGIESITLAVRDPAGKVTLLEPVPVAAAVMATPTAPIPATATPASTATPTAEPSTGGPPIPSIVPPLIGGQRQEDAPLFAFTYKPPRLNGRYYFYTIAQVQVSDDRRLIPYTAVAQTDFNLGIATITISAQQREVNQAARYKTTVTVHVTSDSSQEETLLVSATSSGLRNLTVTPAEIHIPPQEGEGIYTFDIFTDNEPGTQGQLTLHFASPGQISEVQGETHTWAVNVSSGLEVRTEQTETEIRPGEGGDITVHITSDSPSQQELRVSWAASGLNVTDVIPQRINVPAGETTPFTLKVYSDDSVGTTGTITFTFNSTNPEVAVASHSHAWQASVRSRGLGGALFLCVGALALTAGFAFFFIRHRRRQGGVR